MCEFKIGDKAVYPAQGVAEVISIDEKDIAGQRQRFYVLRILDTDRKIIIRLHADLHDELNREERKDG